MERDTQDLGPTNHYRVVSTRSPGSERRGFAVVDHEYSLHREGTDFLLWLEASNKASNTARSYGQKVSVFLNWCRWRGVDWRLVPFADLSRYRNFLLTPRPDRKKPLKGRSVSVYLVALTEFLRWAAAEGLVDSAVVRHLSVPKYVRHGPRGFDAGEDGQRRFVMARALKAPVEETAVEALSTDAAVDVVAACRSSRDLLLIRVMLDSGLRIGEALGLRREDMHLLPSSIDVGCDWAGAHVHVRRRLNDNNAWAKGRWPRSVPVTKAMVDAYADYQFERDQRAPHSTCDYVFINLYGSDPDTPLKYSNAKRCVNAVARRSGRAVRPHMLRHTAATNWLEGGASVDTVQVLLGHASPTSTQVYFHPSQAQMRAAVDSVNLGGRDER